jgi:serine/threonine-protein kinase
LAKGGAMTPGTKLGPYEILALIGAGGMGEVYRARDTKLKRDVALKVLPEAFARDPGRMMRFQREAEVLASLNHPNIAHIYGVEERALVMELVEGESPKGPLSFEDAWKIALQIADALEYAHERGVIHRDLKPANVKVTPDGVVKLLDFGLAKAFSETPDAASADPENSPTITLGATVAGTVLGTAAYMSPEQAKGKKVDKRADIWSWGVVLYELLAGERLFKGGDTADTLGQVLTKEPPLGRVPPQVRRLLGACLQKDPKQRLRDIGDAKRLLADETTSAPSQSRLGWAAAVAFAVIAAGLGWIAWRATRPVEHSLVRISAELVPGDSLSTFRLDQDTILSRNYPGTSLALSGDGTHLVAEVRGGGGIGHLAMRRLDESRFSPLRGTERGGVPFFSPDNRWIAFVANGKLEKVPVAGGAPIPLCEAGNFASGSWGDDGNIIAALNLQSNGLPRGGLPRGALSRIPPNGGTPSPVTELRGGDRSHRWPHVLPGSQAVLFTVYTSESPEDADIEVVSLKTHEQKTLLHGGVMGKYIPASNGSGYLIYLHQNTLYAAPFNLGKLSLAGTARPVLDDVSTFGTVPAEFDFSLTGTFVYVSGTIDPLQSIFWLDGSGKTELLHSDPGYYDSMRFSRDGKYLAFAEGSATVHEDVRVKDLARGSTLRLTSLAGMNNHPVWTPDDKYIVFASVDQPNGGVYWVRSDGSGEPQRVAEGDYGYPLAFSPDGKRLGFTNGSATVEGAPDHPRLGELERFPQASGVILPAFSPDFNWVAYRSDETGTPEVYVRPFPGLGAKRKISIGGGWDPIWSPNGHELFYLSFLDRRIMVVDYTSSGDSFVAGKPRVWSNKQVLLNLGGGPLWPYGLAPGGKRFAVLLYPDGTAEAKPTAQLTFLLNFVDYLRQRVPPGN